MAPALGLYLGELFFDGYNKKQRQQMENDLRLAKKRAQAKGMVWPPPAAAAAAAVPVPAPAVADDNADNAAEDSAENPAKRAKLNPTTEGEAAAEGATSSSAAAAKPAAVEKDDEGQVNHFKNEKSSFSFIVFSVLKLFFFFSILLCSVPRGDCVELRPGNSETHPSVSGRHDPPAHLPTGTSFTLLLVYPLLNLVYFSCLFSIRMVKHWTFCTISTTCAPILTYTAR